MSTVTNGPRRYLRMQEDHHMHGYPFGHPIWRQYRAYYRLWMQLPRAAREIIGGGFVGLLLAGLLLWMLGW